MRVGYVIRFEGKLMVCDSVNESAARIRPLSSPVKTFEARTFDGSEQPKKVTIPAAARCAYISPNSEVEVIARLGDDWKKKDFAALVPGYGDRKPRATETTQPQENDMSKKNKPLPRGGLAAEAIRAKGETKTKREKKPKTPKAKTGTTGERKTLLDHPFTAVLRRLGKEGVGIAHATAILAKHGITSTPASISVQLGFGRNGDPKRAPADLTKAQVEELIASVPSPAESNGAEPAKKKGGRKSKKQPQEQPQSEAIAA